MSSKLTGNERFRYNGKDLDLNILEFWQYKFSEIYDRQDEIAEYIVEKALGLKKSQNTEYWTLWDIDYRGMRIEVKETAYFHSWDKPGEPRSMQRSWGIGKAYSEYMDPTTEKVRNNDIYVFCLITGFERKDANPLNLDNWEFYVVPTNLINRECGDNKTISLGRVRSFSPCTKYPELKRTIDETIDKIKEEKI